MRNSVGNEKNLKFGPDKTSIMINPKDGSNSDIQYHSEISVMDSNRPQQMSQLIKPISQIKKEVSGRSLRFNPNQQKPKIEQPRINLQTKDETSKQILMLKIQNKFKDLLFEQAHLWKKDFHNSKAEIFQLFSFETINNNKENTNEIINYNTSSCFNINIQVFQPSQKFTKIWDLIAILITAYMLFLSSFASTFSLFTHAAYRYIVYTILIYIIFDISVICNKAVILQGELIFNRKIIIKQYLSSHVYSDAIIFLIWIIQLSYIQDLHVRQLLSLFQTIFIIMRLYNRLNDYIDCLYMSGNLSEIIDLIILISCVFFCVHIFACYWTYIAFATEYLDNNWLIKYNVQQQGYWIQYNEAIYWATMTMVTVGYGDVTAANQYEILFSNFAMFISSLVFAYSMNSIGIIIKNISISSHDLKKKLILMNSYMNNNLVNEQIQNRVRNYLKYSSIHDQQINQQEIFKIIDNLPITLQDELRQNIKLRIISNIKLFKNFSQKTQYLAAKSLEMISFIPNDVIFDDIMKKDSSIYFIEQGEVIFAESKTKKQIQMLKQGDVLNQYAFFTNFNLPITAISNKYTELYRISRKDFLEILNQNTKDNEIFHHIKDTLIINQDTSLINLKCKICGKYNHLVIHCPLINFQPNLEKLIKQENFLSQGRRKIIRIDRQKINSLAEYINISTSVSYYQQNEFPQSVANNFEKISQMDNDSNSKDSKPQQNIQHSLSNLPEKVLNIQDKQQQFMQSQFSMNSQNLRQKSVQFNKQISAIPLNNEQQKKTNTNLEESQSPLPHRNSVQYCKPFTRLALQTTDFLDDKYQFQFCDIDLVLRSQIYMPQNHQASVIAQANQKRKCQKQQKLSFKYTFYYKIAKLYFKTSEIKQLQNRRTPQNYIIDKIKLKQKQ